MEVPPEASVRPREGDLRELALLFLKLGTTAFGGPAAHIALMQDEVVRRRAWLTDAEYLDLISAANLIPGPNSTEVAIHIGWKRARWKGLFVAGSAFILPAVLITMGLASVYVRFGTLPQAGWLLYGVKPVILAVVVHALLGLVPKAAPSWGLRGLGVAAIAANALGTHELLVLFGAGFLLALFRGVSNGGRAGVFGPLALLFPIAGTASGASAASASGIFWVFCKTGAVLYGSGYVLFAFLKADLVTRLGWMTEAQLIDAIAAGHMTPGPLSSSATFIGYLLAGPWGAAAATAGIFLPAFFFVAISGPLVPRLRASPLAGAFLDGVNVASMALMAVVTAQLARAAILDLPTAVLGVASAAILLRFRPNATWLILGGAVAGAIVHGARLVGWGA
ncbi:MAG: Chromate transport protein [Thermoanaerobaculia bacterium]|nr:Chromate transport protein [Thermoanaerobaculia bacterium]